jgi:hypothetical protein
MKSLNNLISDDENIWIKKKNLNQTLFFLSGK